MSHTRLSLIRQLLAAILLVAFSHVASAVQRNEFFNAPDASPIDQLQANDELSVGDAQALADSGQPLMLQLTRLDEDVAKVLARANCSGISLRRLSVISEPVAVALASWSGGGSGTGLYAGKKGRLHVGLSAMPDEIAEALSLAKCSTLEVGRSVPGQGIPTISADAAKSLSRYKGTLTIHVERLPPSGEKALAESVAELSLPQLRFLASNELLQKLLAIKHGNFEIALEELDVERAALIAKQELQTLRLPGIKRMSPEVAKILANAKSQQISLMGLEDCPPATLDVLKNNGRILLP